MLFQAAQNNPYIKLEIIGTDSFIELAQIQKYTKTAFPRSFYDESSQLVTTKSMFDTKNTWAISAVVSLVTRNNFEAAVLSNCDFVLNDVFESIVEPTITRSKAIEDTLIQSSGWIEYFAKFLIRIDTDSVCQESLRDGVLLSFTMNELEKLTI